MVATHVVCMLGPVHSMSDLDFIQCQTYVLRTTRLVIVAIPFARTVYGPADYVAHSFSLF